MLYDSLMVATMIVGALLLAIAIVGIGWLLFSGVFWMQVVGVLIAILLFAFFGG